MPDKDAKEVDLAGGKVSSSEIYGFHLIPYEAMVRLAQRFDLGVVRKGDKAWNATTHNQEVLTSKDFILHRISHVIGHAMKLRDKIVAGVDPLAGDDDASAVIWGGAFLCAATKAVSDTFKADRVDTSMMEWEESVTITECNYRKGIWKCTLQRGHYGYHMALRGLKELGCCANSTNGVDWCKLEIGHSNLHMYVNQLTLADTNVR